MDDEVDVPIKKEWTVSTRQIASILTLLTIVSGGGGALTAWGTDELKNQAQDARIAAVEEKVEKNLDDIAQLKPAVTCTETKVDGIEDDVAEIKEDVKKIVETLNQAIGREAGRNGR